LSVLFYNFISKSFKYINNTQLCHGQKKLSFDEMMMSALYYVFLKC